MQKAGLAPVFFFLAARSVLLVFSYLRAVMAGTEPDRAQA
jgi:hypothetical protein